MKTPNKDYIAEVEKMKPALREFYWLISKNKLTEDEFVKDMAHRLELALLQASKRAVEEIMLEERKILNGLDVVKQPEDAFVNVMNRGWNNAVSKLKANIKQYLA